MPKENKSALKLYLRCFKWCSVFNKGGGRTKWKDAVSLSKIKWNDLVRRKCIMCFLVVFSSTRKATLSKDTKLR